MNTALTHDDADKQTNEITYAQIQNAFDAKLAWGLLTCVDLRNCNPTLVRSEKEIRRFVEELCALIDVNRYGDAVIVHFGKNEQIAGYSMVQLIETSLISGHFVNLTINIYIDIFSCKIYDPSIASEFTKIFFEAENSSTNVVLRR